MPFAMQALVSLIQNFFYRSYTTTTINILILRPLFVSQFQFDRFRSIFHIKNIAPPPLNPSVLRFACVNLDHQKTLYTDEVTKMKGKQDREVSSLRADMDILKTQVSEDTFMLT